MLVLPGVFIGDKYLENADLTTPWYLTLRCIALQEKELQKNEN
jgi:hypothetical protein